MKKQLFYLAALCLTGILTLQACKKTWEPNPADPSTTTPINTDNSNNGGYSKTNLSAAFAALKSTPQTFTVTAGSPQTLMGAQGTEIRFYANSFKDAQGNILSSGTVTIKLVEMYSVGDMIANRASTVADGKPLISGGQINIKATMNGQEVFANRYGLSFSESAPSSQPMALFYGNNNNADSITNWNIADTSGNGTTTNGTTNDSMTYYHVFDSVTNFNWINCDYFTNNSGPITNVFVVMPDTTYNPSNTQAFLVFPTINSVTYLGNYDVNTSTFSLYSGYHIPVGYPLHVVVMKVVNGNYEYFELTNQTSTMNMSVTATPAPQSLAYILNQLANL